MCESSDMSDCVETQKRLEQYNHVKVVLWVNTPSLYFWRACKRKSLLFISLKLILLNMPIITLTFCSVDPDKCKTTVLA